MKAKLLADPCDQAITTSLVLVLLAKLEGPAWPPVETRGEAIPVRELVKVNGGAPGLEESEFTMAESRL